MKYDRRIVQIITFLAVLLMAGCLEWSNADSFRRLLRCGMSREEVAALAKALDATDVRCPQALANAPERCAVVSRRTYFELIFDQRGLRAVARGRYTGLYGLEVGLEAGLCRQ